MASGVFGGVTVKVTLREPRFLLLAVMVTVCGVLTALVFTTKRKLVIPPTIPSGEVVAFVGTETTDGLLLVTVNAVKPVGATAFGASAMLTCAFALPTTLEGAMLIVPRARRAGATPVVFIATSVPLVEPPILLV